MCLRGSVCLLLCFRITVHNGTEDSMEANPVRIIQYFDGTKQSVIPLFQRPYTWSKDDWTILWDDIMSQYGPDGGTHFMGAVVSFPVRTVPVGVSKHLIIDGQQRLTTVAILLAALRDSSEQRAADRIQDYLINRHYNGLDAFKLLPTQHDRKTYGCLMLGESPDGQTSSMRTAYQFFKQKLKGDYEGVAIDATRVLEVLEHNLQVVMINLGDSDDPYLIFESLNAKGQPLTEADLVRNYVLMKFKHSLEEGGEQERIHQLYWKPLEDAVGPNLTDFLRHYCMKSGAVVDKRAVYSAVKKLLSQAVDDESLEAELSSMAKLGKVYSSFLNPANESDLKTSMHLSAFNELASTTCYPLLLRLFESYEQTRISRDELTTCLYLIESFVVRRAVCDVPTNVLNRLFVQWCSDYREPNVGSWLRDKMASGINTTRWPSDDSFREAFRMLPQYGGKAARYILTALERNFGHKEPADLKNTTIEHIMPQNLSPEWKSLLGSESDDMGALVHTFGNLTLSGYNPELGNESFTKKRELLKESHLQLNTWIAEQEIWNQSTIERRAGMLAEAAIAIWPGPESSSV